MPAIVTDNFKRRVIDTLINDVDSAGVSYHVAVGKSEPYDSADTVVTPIQNIREIRNAQLSMQSVKIITDRSFCVERYNWSSGSVYSSWDDNITQIPAQPFYVYTDEQYVYVCLEQGKNAAGQAVTSTVKPTGTADHIMTADGYTWKFLYSIGALRESKFQASNFIPVKLVNAIDSSSSIDDTTQFGIQSSAIPGAIVGYRLTNTGSGYTTAPSVTIQGNGTGAKATAFIDGGSISKIEMAESGGNKVFGTGYDFASVSITGGGGTNATAEPIISFKNGFGADPRDDLKCTSLMFNVKPAGDEDSDWVVNNDFRQIMLVRNIKDSANGTIYTGNTGNALKMMNISSINAAFTRDQTIIGNTSGAKAVVDTLDDNSLFYHQNETTGFLSFQNGEVINEQNASGNATIDSANVLSARDVDPATGQILYIDNRAAVTRSDDATEDIKIIIRL
jgi:hypothetical protein